MVKIIWSIVFLLGMFSLSAQETDIYDFNNSKKFAAHLMAAQEYKTALIEYERLAFFQPRNDTVGYQLLLACRLSGDINRGVENFKLRFPDLSRASLNYSQEYLKLLLLQRDYISATDFLKVNQSLSVVERAKSEIGILLVQKQWSMADEYAGNQSINDPVLLSFVNKGKNIKRKKTGLAGGLSTLVPGLGKVYAGNWKDGLISFVFVGANAFAAYRGFSRNGINSAYGWVFTGIGTAFYAGNIYGSYKTAQKYNIRKENLLQHEVEHYLYSGF